MEILLHVKQHQGGCNQLLGVLVMGRSLCAPDISQFLAFDSPLVRYLAFQSVNRRLRIHRQSVPALGETIGHEANRV